MPNKTGGKNYKKSKHGGAEAAVTYIDKQDDQQYGRVIRVLGNGNMLVYCNDNEQRICHIRGAIRKRVWINLGDVVLISLRELGDEARGDILAKIDPKAYSKVKKEAGVNPVLFNNLEGGGSGGAAAAAAEDDDGIEFESAPAGGAGMATESTSAPAGDIADTDMDIDAI